MIVTLTVLYVAGAVFAFRVTLTDRLGWKDMFATRLLFAAVWPLVLVLFGIGAYMEWDA